MLGLAGSLPVVGTGFDLANAAIYAARGKWGDAGLALSSVLLPVSLAAVGGAVRIGVRWGDEAAGATSAVGVSNTAERSLRYKSGWTEEQRAAADAKVAALNNSELVVTPVQRSGMSAASRYRRAGGEIPSANDVDHVIDLQHGGANDILNMSPLDYSVNRRLGAQIACQIRGLAPGTRVTGVSIC